MKTAAKDAEIQEENPSTISRHEMEQLLDLAENLQAKYVRSKRVYNICLVFSILSIVGAILYLAFWFKNISMINIPIKDNQYMVLGMIGMLIGLFPFIFLIKFRKRKLIDGEKFVSVMDMVEEAQRLYTSQMTAIEKAMFTIRLTNLDFDVHEILR